MKTLKLIKCKAPYNSRAFLFNRYQKKNGVLSSKYDLRITYKVGRGGGSHLKMLGCLSRYELLIAEMGLTKECLSDSPRDVGIMLFQELDFAYSYICS